MGCSLVGAEHWPSCFYLRTCHASHMVAGSRYVVHHDRVEVVCGYSYNVRMENIVDVHRMGPCEHPGGAQVKFAMDYNRIVILRTSTCADVKISPKDPDGFIAAVRAAMSGKGGTATPETAPLMPDSVSAPQACIIM